MRNSEAYLLVVIGVVSAFGPFLTDFYLPALPALARCSRLRPRSCS